MSKIQQVSESEYELMCIIWASGGAALYSEIIEALEIKKKDWSKSTTLTFLSRLVEKNILTVNKHGRRNEYITTVTKDQYTNMQTKQFIDKVYEGNAVGLVSSLLQQESITQEDLERLKKLWNKGKDIY